MALTIGDNFSYQGAKPLDRRIKYDTLAAMKAMADSTLYDGCLAYCVATDKTYQWKSTNTVDTDTGRWREFTSGGGTGGGHTIEDPEGTALTQRDTLQFGGDLEVSDDDENEKTVVSPHELTAAELAEIVTPLPSVPVNMPILFDESGAEYQVGWYKYANGTKKPVYQKTFSDLGLTPTFDIWVVIGNIPNLEYIIDFKILGHTNNSINLTGAGLEVFNDSGIIKVEYNQNANVRTIDIFVVQYTKTTDTPT